MHKTKSAVCACALSNLFVAEPSCVSTFHASVAHVSALSDWKHFVAVVVGIIQGPAAAILVRFGGADRTVSGLISSLAQDVVVVVSGLVVLVVLRYAFAQHVLNLVVASNAFVN